MTSRSGSRPLPILGNASTSGGPLQNRLMAMALLHRYSNLPWYLQRLPLPGATRLEQLAAHWWKLDIDEPPFIRRWA